jgi:molybdopterin-synthase adenylyltransferase
MRTPVAQPELTEQQIERYSRQIILSQVGGKGMAKLLQARVAIIGAGGLGCPAAQILAAAGVGNLRIVDGDRVDISNLPRQFLHYTTDLGVPKVDSVKDKIEAMNPDVKVETVNTFATQENIGDLIAGCDYVIDGSDNQATKFLVNDACVHFNIPFTIAGILQFYGHIISVVPGQTTCFRCVFFEPTAQDATMTCSGAGVLGTASGLAGVLQANEAIKSILGLKTKFTNRLFIFDLLEGSFEYLDIKRHPQCRACSNPSEPFYRTADYGELPYACHVSKDSPAT